MSAAVYRWAMRQEMPNVRALVLRALAWHYNDSCKCAWPTLETLANESNFTSVATVKRCLKDFERLGIVRKGRGRHLGKIRVAYALNWDRSFRWKRSVNKCSWSQFVARGEAALAERDRLPGETKEAFVRRRTAKKEH